MHAVRIQVETLDASVEYLVHVRNRSRHALQGAVRAAWKRYTKARSVTAQFTEHACSACSTNHIVPTVRRPFRRVAA